MARGGTSPPRRKLNGSQSRKRAFLVGKGPLTSALATSLGSKAMALSAKFKALDLYISSAGGEVNAGLLIYNTIQTLNVKVRTICFGRAHSVASLVLASGRSGCRRALMGSSVSLHRPSAGSFGNVDEVVQHVSSAVCSEEAVVQAYMKVCDRRLNEVRAAMVRSFAMDVSEAWAWGLIDGIL
ncbi:MAG: ATP-dependent Clp protease proteolytic subunit [Candidatus Hodgkinia cicadicola]